MAQLPPPPDPDDLAQAARAGKRSSGPPPLEPLAPARRPHRWWLVLPVALAVYLLLALLTIVQPVSAAGLSLTVPIPGLSTPRIFGLPDRPMVILIAGLDARPDQNGPSRADSILLLRIDPGKNRASILSVPRDAMMAVTQPGGSTTRTRVNAAYSFNWSRDDDRRAPHALAETIERNLGIKIDKYIVFDWRGAEEIIDDAGGVTITVGKTVRDATYSDDDRTRRPQLFEPGEQHLNGYRAVAYGRIRKGSSDFERIRRQQQVAEALVSQLASPWNSWRLWGVWNAYRDTVNTDLSLRESAGLFVLLKRIGTARIVTNSLGDATVSCTRCQGALLLLQPEQTAGIISRAFDDDAAGQRAAEALRAAGVTP